MEKQKRSIKSRSRKLETAPVEELFVGGAFVWLELNVLFCSVSLRYASFVWKYVGLDPFFMETVIILGFWGVGMANDDRLRLFGSEYSREEKE